ncbi:hypothetical protein FF011L_38950 [Roseimaritima multifibrata]|uniref:Uncharacterized protein n=2 Tax=Roseimaritima multifibrata TaxID=1930274 RepID=A0A517MJU3_9BACT|nr:hypothetical protein FF011L_38950 [Roseimaritima multifibrata]
MAIVIFTTRQEVSRLRNSLSQVDLTAMPISPDAVVTEVHRHIADHPLPCKVTDVRYSETDDTFRVHFMWTDPVDKKDWGSNFELKGDGYGTYAGCIRNTKFLAPIHPPRYTPPLKDSDGMWIEVSTPSVIHNGG